MNQTDAFAPQEKSVNIGIIAVTVVAFLVVLLWEKSITKGSFYGNTGAFFLEHGALYGPAVLEGKEWYRLITYLFLHDGMAHLLHNMLILYFVGNVTERCLGKRRYLVLYFLSGILAGLGSIVYNTSYPVCVGASGAVFGVSGALLYLVLTQKDGVSGLTRRQMLFFAVCSAAAGFFETGVDNAAHIAGLLAGFVLAAVLYHLSRKRKAGK